MVHQKLSHSYLFCDCLSCFQIMFTITKHLRFHNGYKAILEKRNKPWNVLDLSVNYISLLSIYKPVDRCWHNEPRHWHFPSWLGKRVFGFLSSEHISIWQIQLHLSCTEHIVLIDHPVLCNYHILHIETRQIRNGSNNCIYLNNWSGFFSPLKF